MVSVALGCCGSAGGRPDSLLQRWASPRRLLALLCAINLLFFLDRGVVASNGVNGSASADNTDPGISTEFDLSLFEDGLIAALYYVGVMVGAPVFAQLSKHHNVLRLIGAGSALFAVAALVCGFSQSFAMVLVFRCLVGAGTGSLIALGPPLIDDHAPAASTALWLGLFYLCMPTGVALGYLFGGAIGSGLTWRAAFWIEAGLTVPFSLWCLLAPAVDIRRQPAEALPAAAELALLSPASQRAQQAGSHPTGCGSDREPAEPCGIGGAGRCSSDESAALKLEEAEAAVLCSETQLGVKYGQGQEQEQELKGQGTMQLGRGWGTLEPVRAAVGAFFQDLRQLAKHPVAICVIAGLTCWNGFIGAYGYYGPKAVRDLFSIKPDDADFIFGAVLAGAGIFGSLAGGFLLDLLGATMPHGMLLSAVGLAAGFVLVVIAVTAAHSQAAFWPLFSLAEVSVFLVQAPANAVCMWSVPADLRSFALSISEMMQHLLGDIPTPPALGAMQGAVDDWRLSLAVFALLLVVGTAAFLLGALLARRAKDYRQEEPLVLPGGGGTPVADSGEELLQANGGAELGIAERE